MDMIGDVGHVVKCVLVTTMVKLKVCVECAVEFVGLEWRACYVGWHLPDEVHMKQAVNCDEAFFRY